MKFKAKKLLPLLGFAAFCLLIQAIPAYADGPGLDIGSNISDVSKNITHSAHKLPGLISGIAYLLGTLFGALGVLKLKSHVENPNQTSMREGISRLLASGALISMPFMYNAIKHSFDRGDPSLGGEAGFSMMTTTGGALNSISQFGVTLNINEVLSNILTSIGGVPGLVSGIAYLLALVLGVSAILKTREHIDSPEQVPLREAAGRFAGCGALLALPFILAVFQTAIAGGKTSVTDILVSVIGFASSIIGTITGSSSTASCSATSLLSGAAGAVGGVATTVVNALDPGAIPGPTIGDVICSSVSSSMVFPFFLTSMAYLFGIILGVWAILKFKDNILKPDQTSIWEGVSRMLAAGCFFSLPYLIGVAQDTIGLLAPFTTAGFGSGNSNGAGLDAMITKFAGNIYGPMLFLMNFFGYIAGTILLMIAISRLMKSAQEGARGPGGIGTMMTFIAAGALISLSPMISAFGISLFGGNPLTGISTMASISYLSPDDQTNIIPVIEATLQFMIVLGLVSFARGIFIMRGVAEGSGQASMMAGMTHLIGGTLAINLGPMLNAVQSTLGLSSYGIAFGDSGVAGGLLNQIGLGGIL